MLNPQQMAAIHYLDGPLLVLAGAGSGKTRVITEKIVYLINQCDYAANTVCAVTFTNKAANEMRSRVAALLPANKRRGLNLSTFHTLGLRILKKHTPLCQLKPGFSIFDSEDCLQILRTFLPPGKANERDYLLRIQQQISHWKNQLLATHTVPQHEIAGPIYPQYQQTLRTYNAIDFDDLICLPVNLFMNNPDILELWQNKFRHLLVDEYQDSNTSQYLLIKLLVGVRAQFTVVGDDDQSIYAWRGAKPENLAQLKKDYSHLKLIKLEQNYRSTGRILQVANHLISHNPHLFTKKLWSSLGEGELLRVLCCRDEQDEAEQVIADLISHRLHHNRHYRDYAILYRGNHQARLFEKILRNHSIAYRISGGQSWFARTEIKDIFAYLKLLCNEADDASFLRVVNTPKRGIGENSLESLATYAHEQGKSLYNCANHIALVDRISEKPRESLSAFKSWFESIKIRIHTHSIEAGLREMIEESGYEAHVYAQCDTPLKAQKRMDSVWELYEWVIRLFNKKSEQSLADVVNKLILIDVLEKSEESENDTLQLMTLHAAKGLEFPFVYLVGMEEELLPHRVSIETEQIEEERRLAYVGITRAQRGLCLTLAKRRRRGGELHDCLPSRFLQELPQESLEWFGQTAELNEAKSKALAQNHLAGLRTLLT